MIKKLWRKLVLLYTGITGLILAVSLGVAFFYSCSSYKASTDALICDQIASYQTELLATRQVDPDALRELEQKLTGNVYIYENGTPLFRAEQAAGLPTELPETIYRTEHSLSDDALSPAANDWMTKKDDRKTDFGRFRVFYFRQDGKTQIEILALQNRNVRLPFVRRQAAFYGALLLLGCVALAIINGFLLRAVLRPVEASVRQQKEFVAAAGHELKTPLASIRAGLEVLQKHIPDSPEVSGVFYAAQSEAMRMSHLVQELLLLESSDRQDRRLALTTIEPDTFCLQLYEKYQNYAKQQRHPLRLNIENAVYPDILANEEALTEIGSIFISNAIAHTKADTPIEICCALLKNGAVEITVRDHGPGIAEQDLLRIFDRFYRADPGRASNGHYGLGLSIAKSMAEQQSLRIGARNAPGSGAVFYICTR